MTRIKQISTDLLFLLKISLNPSNQCRLEAPTFGIRVPLNSYRKSNN